MDSSASSTKPQVNWEIHMVLFHWWPKQVSEKQSTHRLCCCEPFGGWDHILHSTVLRGDGWGKTLPGVLYTLQWTQFAYNKYCLTLGEPLNGPESLFSPLLTGKSSVSLTEFVKRNTRDLGPFQHPSSLAGCQGPALWLFSSTACIFWIPFRTF